VDGGMSMKRILPAPMGRAFRIKKRSNHVTIVVAATKTKAPARGAAKAKPAAAAKAAPGKKAAPAKKADSAESK